MDDNVPSQDRNPEARADLLGYWRLVLRNRGLVLGAVALTAAVSVAITSVATPIYEATTSLRVDDPNNSALPSGNILSSLGGAGEIETEIEVLRSRTLAASVVDSLDLNVRLVAPKGIPRDSIFSRLEAAPNAVPAEYRLVRQRDGRFRIENETTGARVGTIAPGEPVALPGLWFTLAPEAALHDEIVLDVPLFADAVEQFQTNLTVERPRREANIVTITYEGPDPKLVRRVPDAVARHFINQRNTVQKTEARSTVAFLRGQIDTLSFQLAEAERALQAFREGELVVSLEAEARAQVSHMADFQAERNATEAERIALAELLDDIRRTADEQPLGASPYRRLIAFPTIFRNPTATQIMGALIDLENQRADLLNRRTVEDPDVAALTERIREIEGQLHTLATTYVQGLGNQVSSLDRTLARIGTELERIPAKEVEFARLQRQTKVLEQIYVLLQTRLKEAEIAQAVEDASVRVVDDAIVPHRPIRPRPMLNLMIATLFGLIVGFGAAYTRERLDDTINTRDDVHGITGAPVLGLIPRIRKAHAAAAAISDPVGHDTRLITGYDPQSPVSEAYRSLRTNITFARPGEQLRTLVVTSPTPGDGKTTSAANLAVTLAQLGHRVILIDADMRRGVLNLVFDVPRDPGLSDVLVQAVPVQSAVRTVEAGHGASLDFISSGTLPPNPAELLGSPRMARLLEQLANHYDSIIIDSPPLNMVTDAAILGQVADGVLIVVRAGKTERTGLTLAVDQLRNVSVRILGAVLNDASARREGRYYYRYGYYQYTYAEDGERTLFSVRPLFRWFGKLPRWPTKT